MLYWPPNGQGSLLYRLGYAKAMLHCCTWAITGYSSYGSCRLYLCSMAHTGYIRHVLLSMVIWAISCYTGCTERDAGHIRLYQAVQAHRRHMGDMGYNRHESGIWQHMGYMSCNRHTAGHMAAHGLDAMAQGRLIQAVSMLLSRLCWCGLIQDHTSSYRRVTVDIWAIAQL